MFSLCTTAIAITIPAAQAMYQPYGILVHTYPISDRSSGGRSAHNQMRVSVDPVGSCHVVRIPCLPPCHWMTRAFSSASVAAMSDEKKSGIAVNEAIAQGPRPRG